MADQRDHVIVGGESEQAKALLRLLIVELRVNGRDNPTYRVITPDRAITAGFAQRQEKWAVRESNPEPWA
jgi:hypothetical protein